MYHALPLGIQYHGCWLTNQSRTKHQAQNKQLIASQFSSVLLRFVNKNARTVLTVIEIVARQSK